MTVLFLEIAVVAVLVGLVLVLNSKIYALVHDIQGRVERLEAEWRSPPSP